MELSLENCAAMAPGCYASPSVFSMDSKVCKACPAHEGCSTACVETLQRLRTTINVADLLKRHTHAMASIAEPANVETESTAKYLPSPKMPTGDKLIARKVSVERKAPKFEVSEADMTLAASLNDKPGKEAVRLCKNGMMAVMRAELLANRNPFVQEHPCYLQVTCKELLNGGVTKLSLRSAFMKQLGRKEPWGAATATSHVNIALQMLEGFGFIKETNGNYQLVRNKE